VLPRCDAAADCLAVDAPDVPDAADATAPPAAQLVLQAPAQVRPAEPFPLVVRVLSDGKTDRTASFDVSLSVDVGTLSPASLHVYRGAGTVRVVLDGPGDVRIDAAAMEPAADVAAAARVVTVSEIAADRTVQGTLPAADATWKAGSVVHVTGDLTVPADVELAIGPGVRVLLAPKANLVVLGRVVASGTEEAPILFAPLEPGKPWGGIRHEASHGDYAFTLFTGGGGNASYAFGHSGSQPVLYGNDADIVLQSCVLADNPGKGLGGEGERIRIEDSIVTRCDTGGELKHSHLVLLRSHFLEMPNADGVFVDDDNDGIYLSGQYEDASGEFLESIIEGCVFTIGKDDGIDHNGADVRVSDTIIEGFMHEGVAASKGGTITIVNTLVRLCEQGIEAGYGAPTVIVDHCTTTDNKVGLRYGDSYDWEVEGTLTVTSSVSSGNTEHNVRNFVNLLGGPAQGAVDISCSALDDPAWDGVNGNASGTPVLTDSYLLAPGSPGKGAACDGTDPGLVP
jgi:hypothetical protein